jgi:hypothetical protein
MAKPTTREQFKEYCLRKLGKPVLEINVADEQVEDRIDEALAYWQDYHYDGSQKVYLSHEVTQEDIDNKYFDIPSTYTGVINIFPIGNSYSTNNLFNIRYQIALNDLYAFTTTPIAPYYMVMQNIALIEELFVGKQSLRFNRHNNRLYIDMAWKEKVNVGEYIIVEAYEAINPETYTDAWADWWLQDYTTALIKKQWGDNLKKFEGMTMPGGVTFNGQKIWDEATDEITKLEEEMISSFSLPVSDMVG